MWIQEFICGLCRNPEQNCCCFINFELQSWNMVFFGTYNNADKTSLRVFQGTYKHLALLPHFISTGYIQSRLDSLKSNIWNYWIPKLRFYWFLYSYQRCGGYFYKSESPKVRIYSHFEWFELVKKVPTISSY